VRPKVVDIVADHLTWLDVDIIADFVGGLCVTGARISLHTIMQVSFLYVPAGLPSLLKTLFITCLQKEGFRFDFFFVLQ
jgi:hypothetical protein